MIWMYFDNKRRKGILFGKPRDQRSFTYWKIIWWDKEDEEFGYDDDLYKSNSITETPYNRDKIFRPATEEEILFYKQQAIFKMLES